MSVQTTWRIFKEIFQTLGQKSEFPRGGVCVCVWGGGGGGAYVCYISVFLPKACGFEPFWSETHLREQVYILEVESENGY